MENPVIQTRNLTKKFGSHTAVDQLDLNVPKGAIYGFLGPNGAGKSTTIRMLLGLMSPSSGEVRVFGLPLESHRMEILKRTGSLVESPSYYGHLSARENLELTRLILGLPAAEIGRVLEVVGLSGTGRKKVGQFSMGMKQRLGIAHALLGSPALLVLDEPTNGLDPAGIHEMRELVRSLPTQTGATLLVSSHILPEVEQFASHVGIIQGGRLIFQGELDALKAQQAFEIFVDARPQAEAVRLLAAQGLSLDAQSGLLKVRGRDLDEAALNRLLVTQGFEVYHLSRKQSALEDIFLNLTNGSGAADAQPLAQEGAAS